MSPCSREEVQLSSASPRDLGVEAICAVHLVVASVDCHFAEIRLRT